MHRLNKQCKELETAEEASRVGQAVEGAKNPLKARSLSPSRLPSMEGETIVSGSEANQVRQTRHASQAKTLGWQTMERRSKAWNAGEAENTGRQNGLARTCTGM